MNGKEMSKIRFSSQKSLSWDRCELTIAVMGKPPVGRIALRGGQGSEIEDDCENVCVYPVDRIYHRHSAGLESVLRRLSNKLKSRICVL
jgi:hypothetical protein